jgi:hypothetical protein
VFFLYADNFINLKEHTPSDFPVVKAFRKASFDSANPAHWRVLMVLLCWTLFPPQSSAGRPSEWTDDEYYQLLREVHAFRETLDVLIPMPATFFRKKK